MRANQKTDIRLVKQLSEADLENVCGGTKNIGKSSSPNLFSALSTGQHISTAIIH
jgi:hypothetical protein